MQTVGQFIEELQKLPVNDSIGFNVTVISAPMPEQETPVETTPEATVEAVEPSEETVSEDVATEAEESADAPSEAQE